MQRKRRRWWTRLVTVVATLTILAASISVLFQLALDAMPGYRVEIEQFVARSVGHPARIGGIALTWSRLRPTLELRNIALFDGASGVTLLEARRLRLGFGIGRLIRGRRDPSRIEIVALQLYADVDAAGHWSLRGFQPTGFTDWHVLAADLGRFDDIRIEDSQLLLHDQRLDASGTPALAFVLRSASIHHDGSHYKAGAVLIPPTAMAQRIDINAALSGDLAQPQTWRGGWRLAVYRISGWPWLAAAMAPDVELSFNNASLLFDGQLDGGRIHGAELSVQAASVQARQGGKLRAQVSALHWRTQAEAGADGAWRLNVTQLALLGPRGAWHASAATAQRATDADGGAWTIDVAALRLDDFAPWLALARTVPPELARLGDLHGDLTALQLRLTPAVDPAAALAYQLSAQVHGVGLRSEAGQPGFSGLDGVLTANADGGALALANTPLTLQLPAIFEKRVELESLRADLGWQRDGEGWRVTAPDVALRTLGTTAEGRVMLHLPPQAPPQLTLQLQLASADAAVLKPLMPKTWGPNAKAWLNRALLRAPVTRGAINVDAALTAPTADGRSTIPWTLDLDLADAELDYAPGWPAAKSVKAELRFHDFGLDIGLKSGDIGGTQIQSGSGRIADLLTSDLVLDGRVVGDGGAFYRTLRAAPIAQRLPGLLGRTDVTGSVTLDLKLKVLLHAVQTDVDASGVVALDNAQLSVRGLDEPIRNLNGRLSFDVDSVHSEALGGRLYDTPLVATIRAEAGAPGGVLNAEFEINPRAGGGLAAAFLPSTLREMLSGSSRFKLRLPLSGADAGRMSLSSELRGIASTLPPPLAKAADAALPLNLVAGSDGAVPLRVQLQLGDVLRAGLRFSGSDTALRARGIELRLGSGEVPRADADGLIVKGAVADLDVSGWLGLLSGVPMGEGVPPFFSADVSAEHLSYRRLALGATHVVATRAADGVVSIRADGAAEGLIEWRAQAGGSVRAQLQHLALAALPPLPPEPAETPKAIPFDPAAAPTLNLDSAQLSLGAVDLGHLHLATARVADGQRIKQLQLEGGKLVVDAHGSWLRHGSSEAGGGAGSSAELNFEISSSAIADVLQVFGYAANLRAEEAAFSGKLQWPRVPAGLELSQAQGNVKLDIRRGALNAVKPGAGRVLGLFNLYALPRRLLFDFRDVVSKGLSFDTIKGQFALADGNAHTDDLQINGPSVKLQMKGRIGLAARDYDQRITVYPDISTGVTLGATLLGGPLAGGIALVAQQLFSKPFNKLSKFSYRVTGSWDNPEVIKGGEETPPPLANGEPHG
jgi:uncharacterized protein (TIGR02099 family)